MAMTTSWGWRSRCRGASGISLISLTLLLMQLMSLLLLLSSGLGPKIQSGGGEKHKTSPWLPPAVPRVQGGSKFAASCYTSSSGCLSLQECPLPTPAPSAPSTPLVLASLLFPALGWFSGCWFLEALPA